VSWLTSRLTCPGIKEALCRLFSRNEGEASMEISTLLIRVVFLALPGFMASKLYWKLRGHPKRETWERLFDVMLFSLLSYIIFFPVALILDKLGWTVFQQDGKGPYLGFLLDSFVDEKEPLQWPVILGSSIVALVLALLASYNHKYSLVVRTARLLRATSRLGDEDIWDTFFNQPQIGWVVVHDTKRNLMFYGYTRFYSDSDAARVVA
jgi:hypothetical protein